MAKGKKTGGRRKGTPNKLTTEVRMALEEAFQKLGGIAALVEWGKDNPDLFYALWTKLLPVQVKHTGQDGGAIAHEHRHAVRITVDEFRALPVDERIRLCRETLALPSRN